ncbi:acyl-CoA thioesterase [Desulfosporosinus sp. FKB]|uniref:acyl-CoA thioesterase n=1 Tax=Desulfosporosinus sp. FKB TaxID=1969835 RepID=UPI000B4994D8|nr:acyl-CoA thioesterase [Desulfosporosinus sp. FKB]
MAERPLSEANLVMSVVMQPSQANYVGNIHGGEIMKLMDSAAYAVARKHSHTNVVTARVDEIQFHLPIFVGELITCTAQIIFTGRTSMEVAVTVNVEDLDSDEPPKKALTAHFTMVALDKKGIPTPVPLLSVQTEEEKELFELGKRRYEYYKSKKDEVS